MNDNVREKYGDWALITGASSGIGQSFAEYLAKAGMNVIAVARRRDRLEALAGRLQNSYHVEILPVVLDLTQENFLDVLVQVIGDRRVGMLINNAGYGKFGSLLDHDLHYKATMVKLNCLAPVVLTHYFLQQMVRNKKGAVIFVGSIVGYLATPYYATYAATKAFNIFMGEALWEECRSSNVDVLALSPGTTATEFTQIAGAPAWKNPATPEAVVRAAMNALGKKPAVIVGFINKLMPVLLRFAPRRYIVSMVGVVLRRMQR